MTPAQRARRLARILYGVISALWLACAAVALLLH